MAVQIIANIVLYATAFVVFFILLPTIFVHILWMVPFVPTPMSVIHDSLTLAKLKGNEVIYDLGAGDGRLVIEAKRRYPNVQAIGYELAIGVWMLAQLRRMWLKSKAKISMKNFMSQDLSDADVLFTYLSPGFMREMLPKLKAELKPGTKIISHAFVFPDRKPTATKRCHVSMWGSKNVYLYTW